MTFFDAECNGFSCSDVVRQLAASEDNVGIIGTATIHSENEIRHVFRSPSRNQ